MAKKSAKRAENVLALAADRGVRLVGMELLDDASAAADKLERARDAKTLHAFRVALRRLRSWLRAFKSELRGAVRRKDRRRLRDIAAATNLGRDTDVQIEWLREAAKGLSRKRKRGADWLAQYLAVRQRQAGDPLDAALLKEFDSVRQRLAEALSTVTVPVRPDEAPRMPLARLLAGRMMQHVDALAAELRNVRSSTDEEMAHRARIAAKRLRYLLEPAVAHARKGEKLLVRLKGLQDELGALHDAHVMGHQLKTAMQASASASVNGLVPDAPRDGLAALQGRLEADTTRAFERMSADWRDGALATFSRDVAGFARRLEESYR